MSVIHSASSRDYVFHRDLAADLSGYLCGTALGRSRTRRSVDPSEIASRHRALQVTGAETPPTLLGGGVWNPASPERELRDRLAQALSEPGVLDLVLFGSQARGALTGYSDVDAVLVLDDSAADDSSVLKKLRPSILGAQRAVVAYQPMQHHGFLVATPRLLTNASAALGMPSAAFGECVSLMGTATPARFPPIPDPGAALRRLVQHVLATTSWPHHPWVLHGRLAIIELLPTLYLQSTQRPTAKHFSFAIAEGEFGEEWWPYRRLAEIRERWPRRRQLLPELMSLVIGNPWLAIAGWRRLPGRAPGEVREYLTPDLLRGVHAISRRMCELASC